MRPERRLSGRNGSGRHYPPHPANLIHSGVKAINPRGLGTESPSQVMSSDHLPPNELVPILDPELLQARWILGGLRPEDLVSHALSALQLGFSGVALQQLAGLFSPTQADLGNIPERAFAEMGLKPMDKRGAVDFLVARGGFSRSDIFRVLLTAFPSFTDRWREHIEWWGGEPAGDYNDMAEFVHFVVDDLQASGKIDDIRRVFEVMESQLEKGDQGARDLIGWGFFETLQNVASHGPNGYQEYEEFLGPLSARIWVEIQKAWKGKSSLADVVRAERRRG
jgi:hypothetical protein